MSQYEKLAEIYDYLVAGIDYDEWADYIEQIAARFSCNIQTIADLACGTGCTTLPLASRGYRVYGIDLSSAMLQKALEKARQMAESQSLTVNFLEQDMRELYLPEPMDLVTCYHDGLNYILELEQLKVVFNRVFDSLRPGGLFIFDLNAVEKLSAAGGDVTFVDDTDMSLIWETSYDKGRDVWEIRLTGFLKKGEMYEKFIEEHSEKSYKNHEALQTLSDSGFEVLDVYHGFSFDPPKSSSRRLFYVARKPE